MVTRHLYVLRHAKSSWDDPFLSDAERPLNNRGRAATETLRRHFADIGLTIDLVLCSPAQRTRETWDRVAGGVRGEPQVRYPSNVYGATGRELLELVRQVPDDMTALLIVGHNPGVEELLTILAGPPGPVPTSAFATLEISGGWAGLDRATATLRDVVRVRELTGEQRAE
jgi:phosphohistidine phosphatase